MFIRDALSSLPTRPVLFLVPAIVVLVLGWYYRDLYVKCGEIRADRAALSDALLDAASGGLMRLERLTEFPWDQVRIIAGYRPGGRGRECPFGWNWPAGQREALVGAGHLTALVFARDGAIVRYVELDGGRIEFPRLDGNLAPAEAVFRVHQRNGGATLRLELAGQESARTGAASSTDPGRAAGS